MLTNITVMIIDSKTSIPMQPTIMDSLLDPREMKDLVEFEDGFMVCECVDGHGITGQELLLSVGVLIEAEQPER